MRIPQLQGLKESTLLFSSYSKPFMADRPMIRAQTPTPIPVVDAMEMNFAKAP